MIKLIISTVALGLFAVFFLTKCFHTTGAITTEYTGSLIPFVEYDSTNEKLWGYLDEDTGEIVIKAQYVYATPFAGNFAAVRNGWHEGKSIINKDGKTVSVGRFDRVYFITSENGKSTAAVLETEHTRKKLHIGWVTGAKSGFYTEEYFKYRMVNPVTGETIIPEQENYLIYHIETAGDYFLVDTDLFQFMDNGNIECVAKDNPALAASILEGYFEQRGINAHIEAGDTRIKIDYSPYIEKKYANPDISGAFKDLDPEFDIPFEEALPFYRDPHVYLNTPLEITERNYVLYFKNTETNVRAIGVYSESKAKWIIEPVFNFFYTSTNMEKTYYTVDIFQTNNPDIYRIYLTNDETGWDRHILVSGGIYSTAKQDFVDNLYLFEDFPPQAGLILSLGGGGERPIKFPDYGVYYRDYSRVKE